MAVVTMSLIFLVNSRILFHYFISLKFLLLLMLLLLLLGNLFYSSPVWIGMVF